MGIGANPFDDNNHEILGWDATNHAPAVPQITTTSVDAAGVRYGSLSIAGVGVDTSASGTVTNDNDAVSVVLPGGQATGLIQIVTSNLNGTLLFEVSPDSGANYYAIQASQLVTSPTVIASQVVGTGGSQAAGVWRCNISGFTNFRVRLHPTTSGSATIAVRVSQGVHNVTVTNSSALGQATMVNSAPVVPASDYVSPVKSVRTEIAGQVAANVTGTTTDLILSTDVTGYTVAVLQLTGTWSMTLQAQQCNDNATFLQTQFISAQTQITNAAIISTTTTNGMFIIPISGRYLRIRPSVWSSNASCVGTLELYSTPPPFALALMASSVNLAPQTTGGTTTFHLISAASTNATNIKNSAGQVYGYEFSNNDTGWAYVKFYNKATAPTVGTDTVIRTVGVPPAGRANYHSTVGIPFATGISIGTTGGATASTSIQDSSTAVSVVNTLTIDIDYK